MLVFTLRDSFMDQSLIHMLHVSELRLFLQLKLNQLIEYSSILQSNLCLFHLYSVCVSTTDKSFYVSLHGEKNEIYYVYTWNSLIMEV